MDLCHLDLVQSTPTETKGIFLLRNSQWGSWGWEGTCRNGVRRAASEILLNTSVLPKALSPDRTWEPIHLQPPLTSSIVSTHGKTSQHPLILYSKQCVQDKMWKWAKVETAELLCIQVIPNQLNQRALNKEKLGLLSWKCVFPAHSTRDLAYGYICTSRYNPPHSH